MVNNHSSRLILMTLVFLVGRDASGERSGGSSRAPSDFGQDADCPTNLEVTFLTPTNPSNVNNVVLPHDKSHDSSSMSDSCSDISTLPDNVGTTTESWLVTPPPCFTAGGLPHDLEMNPMENLLIEHPSMSVYGPRGRQNSTGIDSMHSESSDDVEMAEQLQPSTTSGRGRHIVTSQRHPPHRPRAVAARAGLLAIRSEKSVRLAQHAYNTRSITKNNLRRSNKVHEFNGRGMVAFRKNQRISQPAGRVNNRRC